MFKTCDTPHCEKQFTEDQSSGATCYRCKLDGLMVNWVGGGGYGRDAFHSGTVKEHIDSQLAQAKAKGVDAVPIPQRAELI